MFLRFVIILNLINLQNMKINLAIVLTSLFLLIIISCGKSSVKPSLPVNKNTVSDSNNNNATKDTIYPNASIMGKWSLMSDSFYFVDYPPFWKPYDSVYIGQPSDYYIFNTDSRLFRSENARTDTSTFQELANNQISFFNIPDYSFERDSLGYVFVAKDNLSYTITNLTDHNLTLVQNLTSNILTPEGYYANTVKLKR